MVVEGDEGPWGIGVGVLGEHRLPAAATLAPVRIIQADAGGKIGPAVPGSLRDLVEVFLVANDVALAAFVNPVLGREEPAVSVKGNTIRVAQPPGDQLQITAVGVAAQDRPGAFDTPRDHLPRLSFRAEGHVRPGADGLRDAAEDVLVLVVTTHEGHVLAGYVVELGERRQPLVREVVSSHDTGVGGRALPEIELVIRAGDRVIGHVVALPGQVGD